MPVTRAPAPLLRLNVAPHYFGDCADDLSPEDFPEVLREVVELSSLLSEHLGDTNPTNELQGGPPQDLSELKRITSGMMGRVIGAAWHWAHNVLNLPGNNMPGDEVYAYVREAVRQLLNPSESEDSAAMLREYAALYKVRGVGSNVAREFWVRDEKVREAARVGARSYYARDLAAWREADGFRYRRVIPEQVSFATWASGSVRRRLEPTGWKALGESVRASLMASLGEEAVAVSSAAMRLANTDPRIEPVIHPMAVWDTELMVNLTVSRFIWKSDRCAGYTSRDGLEELVKESPGWLTEEEMKIQAR